MAQISIPGGGGSTLTFSVTGSSASNYAHDFTAAVQQPTAISTLSAGGAEPTVAGALNIITASATQDYNLTTGRQYTYASVSSATLINGSDSGGDTILAGGGVTYAADGNANHISFFEGNNSFDGGNTSGNTVAGGSGADTISAGTGAATIFGGSGSAMITLNDTLASAGDIAVDDSGQATVDAFGAADTVFAAGSGVVNGGAHLLTFVSGPNPSGGTTPLPVTVVGSTGGANMFGVNGSNVTFENAQGAGLSVFVAGAGNETLNAGGAAGGVAFFGDANASDSGSVNESVTGGAGNNFFMTGTGIENITGGTGTNLFSIDSVAGGNVTISGFNAHDFVEINGLSSASSAALVASDSTVSGGNLTITLGNGTTVEFMGVSSLSGHIV